MTASGATAPTLLIVAKAPVPGLAKTRIGRTIGDVAAAKLAAAALLDTLHTASLVGWPVVVAMTGDLGAATEADEIAAALLTTTVIQQRGEGLGERLADAHLDADRGLGVVQVGMDTPHLAVEDYAAAGQAITRGERVIGPAEDGGWWLLGLPCPADAHKLIDVPMSQHDTLAQTESAFGGDLVRLRNIRDMDTWGDAVSISHTIPDSRLAQVVRDLEVQV